MNMRISNIDDTIAAVATPIGESGIGIVRLSGKEALAVADKIFVSKGGQKPSSFKTYTTHYGWVVENRSADERLAIPACRQAGSDKQIDEVILTVMRAPRSYTKEDIVEINCHGGIVAMRAILDLVLDNGARLAEPGEFTKRAFLNGRIDLAQAEAVLDIIRAKTDAALKIGTTQLKGALSHQINNVSESLLEVLSILEANIDFPEEEISAVNLKQITEKLTKVNDVLKNILENAGRGRIIREGIHVVICGKPNAGKSSTLNALLGQERSIVTAVAGTTRDTIEEVIDIKGIPIRIVDTAGILEPRDLVEKKAVERSKRFIDLADLIILLFDGSRRLSGEDELLIAKLKKKTVIAVINKADLEQKIERNRIFKKFNCVVEISAKKNRNINLLEEEIAGKIYKGEVPVTDSILISKLRHITIVKEAQKLIAQARDSLDNKVSVEFAAQDIKDALSHLDEISGKKFCEDLLDRIFNDFCIGK